MNMTNKIAIKKIPVEVLINAQKRLDEVINIVEPYVVALTPSERQTLVKIGAESIKFLELAHTFAVEYPGLFPIFRKAAVFKEEFFTVRELWTFGNKLEQLKSNVSDTEMAAGSHALETALDFSHTVKIAARHDIPGARVIYEELKPRFPSKRRNQHRIKDSQAV